MKSAFSKAYVSKNFMENYKKKKLGRKAAKEDDSDKDDENDADINVNLDD